MSTLIGIVFQICLFAVANAQKLPLIQQANARAPQNAKADGRLTEWTNMPWAYNETNRIYYLVANDDVNLYLAIRGEGAPVTTKVLNGGIAFTISHTLDKKARAKAADNAIVTFPVSLNNSDMMSVVMPMLSLRQFKGDTTAHHREIDSIRTIAGKRLTTVLKQIGVSGLKGISESTLPIYNDKDIVAAGKLQGVQPIFEIAVPLKYLGLDFINNKNFSYSIKLDIPPFDPTKPRESIMSERLASMPSMEVKSGPPPTRAGLPMRDADMDYQDHKTELWGEYTLVEK
ncbi:hypothetical protein ACFQZS_01015 [Mucilaginibacter calamicampi]|uniref:Uncharacterized protein n=1 Tax=Mucilaginibacter calamicampi TaxID=1302352 RepID=A0ABW2YRI2_9SPHI